MNPKQPLTPLSLCRQMLDTIQNLGGSPTARIDAREWARYYQRKLNRLAKRKRK